MGEINQETAIRYLRELKDKYPPDAIIAEVPSNLTGSNKGIFNANNGNKLKGRMLLEVPVQTKTIPKKVLEYAKNADIDIRDINGKIYK